MPAHTRAQRGPDVLRIHALQRVTASSPDQPRVEFARRATTRAAVPPASHRPGYARLREARRIEFFAARARSHQTRALALPPRGFVG
jgi:hypothetical protein